MTTRAETLIALRIWNAPVGAAVLSKWMGKSSQHVGNNLSALWARDLIDRKPDPIYPHRFLYYPRSIDA